VNGKNASFATQSLVGWLALLLFSTAQFWSVAMLISLFVADAHGHSHTFAIRVDGRHFDIVMSHHESLSTSHCEPLSLKSQPALCSFHDHQNNTHVLHFISSHGDTLKSRVGVQSPSPRLSLIQFAIAAADQFVAASNFPGISGQPPPTDALLCLRTTVLLI
jgi:hypothetical protein